MRIIPMLFLVALLLSCKQKKEQEGTQPPLEIDKISGESYIAILSGNQSQSVIKLSAKELTIIDSLIKDAVINYNHLVELNFKNRKHIDPSGPYNLIDYTINLKKYKRQYIVSLTKANDKEVFVNCLCTVSDNSWKTKEIVVQDGGQCFFNLKINLTVKKHFEFAVNGKA